MSKKKCNHCGEQLKKSPINEQIEQDNQYWECTNLQCPRSGGMYEVFDKETTGEISTSPIELPDNEFKVTREEFNSQGEL